jgi:hypothetical protein
MIYLNLRTATLRSPEYIGSEPTARATWLSLLCYCCEQENNGIIEQCAGWKDRQWQQTCGVTLSEVTEASPLWKWTGDNLAVMFYPLDKQSEVQAKREAGRKGGKRSGKSRREAVSEPQLEAPREAQLEAQLEGEVERKGKERNGMERKRKLVKVAEVSATADKEFLEELSNNAAYQGINISVELGKMQAWCKANGKMATRKRFINWINRAERPLVGPQTALQGRAKPLTAWEIQQAIKAAQSQASRLKGDPANSEPIDSELPWERRLKPEVAAKVKELKTETDRLNSMLAMIGRESQ